MLLCIALIAVVATVFVIAASLLGRAIEEASREQEEIARKKSKEFDEIIRGIKKKLKAAKKTEAIDSLQQELDEYKKKKIRLDKDSERISQRYGWLTVKGGVVYPSIFFLISLALASVARYVAVVPLVSAANSMWALSLLALAWGSYRVYQSLKVIESVAITTEEAQFKRTTQALEIALERYDERRRPKLNLIFKKGGPPFSYQHNTTNTLDFKVELMEGDVARQAEVWFFAPEGFEFTEGETWRQNDTFPIPNALTTVFQLGDLQREIGYLRRLIIKTPPQQNEYSLGYRLYCEGSAGDFTWFKIKVE